MNREEGGAVASFFFSMRGDFVPPALMGPILDRDPHDHVAQRHRIQDLEAFHDVPEQGVLRIEMGLR